MININQNSAIQSCESALIPKSDLIDGRSEIDRLSFLVDFSSLINFYDKRNKINGNWQPFLLKDPVLLVASMSKTHFKSWYDLYVNATIDLNKVINNSPPFEPIEIPINQKELRLALDQVFYTITSVYEQIEYWTRFMQQSSLDYNLKSYIIKAVKGTYGARFWAVVALKEYLIIQNVIQGLKPLDNDLYNSYDSKIWKVSKDKEPFWVVLGLYDPDDDNVYESFQVYAEENKINDKYTKSFLNNIYSSLKNVGDITYSFLKGIVDYALVEYNDVKMKKDNYPDTLLIRTFVDLMGIYKDQLNSLANKHLDFYYRDILKQTPQMAQPDAVYACADLSYDDGTYYLKEGTKFNAGEDEDDETILFYTDKNTLLNPAAITQGYTLTKSTLKHQREQLNFESHKELSEVKTDENGKVQSWKTFGSTTSGMGTNMSLVIASPMLYLGQANQRTVSLKFTFKEAVEASFFNDVKYALSTEEDWFTVVPEIKNSIISELLQLLELILHDIEKFIEHVLKRVEKGVKEIFNLIEKTIRKLNDLLKDIYSKLKEILKEDKAIIAELKAIFEKIWDDMMHGNIKGAIEEILYFLKILLRSLSNRFQDILKAIFEAIKNVSSYVFDQLKDIGRYIIKAVQHLGGEIYKALKKIFGAIEDESAIKSLKKTTVKLKDNTDKLYADIESYVDSIRVEYRSTDTTESSIESKFKYKDLVFEIVLNADDPAIVSFAESPDGVESTWPMFKMEFNEFLSLNTPPQVEKLEIEISVKGTSNFVLYNDFGALDPKKPFQIFGVTADEDQSFYVGSSEVFSKPLMELDYNLKWDNLPIEGFNYYYQQYNDYLNNEFEDIPLKADCKKSAPIVTENSILSVLLEWIKKFIISLFIKKIEDSTSNEPINEPSEEVVVSYFNDYGFRVSFAQLSNNSWLPFKQKFLSEPPNDELEINDDVQLFYTLNQGLLGNTEFRCGDDSNTIQINSNPNPNLQKIPLEFSDSTRDGFLRMQLTSLYGFGNCIYPQVVSAIAVYNSEIIACTIASGGKYKCPPTQPANLPYVPTVGEFTGNYVASYTYDFNSKNIDYPIECFYYTPFNKYKVYDNQSGLNLTGTIIGSKPTMEVDNVLPLYPAFKSEGQLFLSLEKLLSPNAISFYFELTNNTLSNSTNGDVSFQFLNDKGWQDLDVLSDETSNLSCSGIITLNVTSEIKQNYLTFPSDTQWISLSVNTTPDGFPETSFLKSNGFKLIRTGESYLESKSIPKIKAGTISTPEDQIPQIETVIQPFPSFGGKAKETASQMENRTSTRLKTKDRLITSLDYFRSIQLKFQDIYFSKVIYDPLSNITEVALVKKVNDWKNTNAFLPLVTLCKELDILSYLEDRVSGSVNLQVTNFKLRFVKIIGSLVVANGFSIGEVANSINNQLNIFIAPWITSSQDQIEIDTGLNTSEIANFIQSHKSIKSINKLQLQIGAKQDSSGLIDYERLLIQNIEETDSKSKVETLKKWWIVIEQISSALWMIYEDPFQKIDLNVIELTVKTVLEENDLKNELWLIQKISEPILKKFQVKNANYDLKKIEDMVQKVLENYSVCNTAYIGPKTLLVPSLDVSSLIFTSE